MPRSGDDARRRLQQAALELFRERGYEATTTAEIAARAGVTERTFFRHFADKREVLFEGPEILNRSLTAAIAAAPKNLRQALAMRTCTSVARSTVGARLISVRTTMLAVPAKSTLIVA